ncbi:MAG TPA: OsmC family protein [Thermoanaerobaculia bacterium]
MNIEVSFPGGVAVDATFHGHTVHTDQPPPLGEDSAASPFDLFLASIATCAGFYALRFCQQRNIPIEGLGVTMKSEKNPESKRIETAQIELRLPQAFPEKYRSAILLAVDQCTVKKHIMEPPKFEIDLV